MPTPNDGQLGATLSPQDQELVDRVLPEIRISSGADWFANGTARMRVVNKFDSFGKAGLQVGDELLAINGAPMRGDPMFQLELARAGVGGTVTIRIRRGGQMHDLAVQLLKARKLSFDISESQVDLERKIAPADST